MREYKLQKMGKYTRKSEVRRQHLEIRVPALIICFLLACLIWLYVVGLSRIPVETPGTPDGDPPCSEQETYDAEDPSALGL
ncbi:MAG: hypothetical protein J6K29_06690 [Clostridia bacterium]|nr:hypothetical protein [Clostridia bacterium]